MVQSTTKATIAEPFWTWLVLGARRRPGHRRPLLASVAAVHLARSLWALRRLRRSPGLVDDRKWVAVESVACLANYLLYPALQPRRTYWRGRTGDVAFFMQVWGPGALMAASLKPVAGLVGGVGFAAVAHWCAAWVNGEPFIPPRDVRRRMATYTGAAVAAAAASGLVAEVLREARIAMDAEQDLHATLAGQRAGAIEAAEVRDRGRATLIEALRDTRAFITERLPPLEAARLLAGIDDRIAAQWQLSDEVTLSALVRSTGSAFGVSTTTDIPDDITLPSDMMDFVRFVVEVCADNTRRHGNSVSTHVTLQALDDVLLLTITDDGVGFPAGFHLRPGHGLAHATDYARMLGGTLRVTDSSGGGAKVVVRCPMR